MPFLREGTYTQAKGFLEGCRAGILSVLPDCTHMTGFGLVDRRWQTCCESPQTTRTPAFERLKMSPHPQEEHLRTSTSLGILFYGRRSSAHFSGAKGTWKPSKKGPDPTKEKGALLGAHSPSRAMKKQPDGQSPSTVSTITDQSVALAL